MSTVQAATSATNSNTGAKGKTFVQETQDRFLKLLVTQMRNQDPLNPMDNAQLTSQLAQLNTVEGINTLNTTLQSLADSFGENKAMQAASLVGRGILASGSTLQLAGGAAVGGVDLSQPADKVVVTISDAAGVVQQRMDMGPQKEAGVVGFKWDGVRDNGSTAPAGAYTFKVEAVLGTSQVNAGALSFGQVGSVSLGSGGTFLNSSVLGAVALASVKQIF